MTSRLNKIGIIDRSSSGWSAGESYTKSVLRSLAPFCRDAGVELVLFTPGDGKNFAGFPQVRLVHFAPSANKDGLIDALKTENPSAIFPVLDDPIHRISCPVIAWIPDLQHRFLPEFFNAPEIEYRDKLFQTLSRQAAFTVASSENSRRALVTQGVANEEAAQALPFPSSLIDENLPADPLSVLEKYHLPTKFALVANQFWKHKNHEVVLKALALLQKEMPDLVLVLTGMPTDFRDPANSALSGLFQEIAASAIHRQVMILGQIPRADLVALMRLTAVLIQPSTFEGWSTSVEDAKALGRPVICSNLDVLQEQAPQALGFFGVNEPAGLAAILRQHWPTLTPGPDFQKEQEALRAEHKVADNFGRKLFDLCARAAALGKIPDSNLQPIAPDLHAWESQQKEESIQLLVRKCADHELEIARLNRKLESRGSFENTGFPRDPVTDSGAPDAETLLKGPNPEEEWKRKEKALHSLRLLLEEKEDHVAMVRVFNWWKLGRINPFRNNDPETKLGDLRRALWHTSSRYYQMESILHEPPFFCFKALCLKIYFLITRRRLIFFNFIFKKWAKHRKARLGILYQVEPAPVLMETFPRPALDDAKLPSISIVTPSYRQAPFIEETLRSVLDQKYPRLDYHVQDGGSKDGTVEILQNFQDRFTSWESAPDKGQSDAILKGFQRSTGDIMAWLNSDDVLLPGSLRYIGEYFANHPEVDVIYGHRVVTNERSLEIGRWFLPSHSPESLKWVDFIPQETLFWRRKAWEKVGGLDASFHFALDWDLLLRFQSSGQVIRRLPYFIGCFRVHSSQKTSSIIESTGQKEMDQLRMREHGRPCGPALVALHSKPILVKSSICEVLWKKGIRI